MEEFNSDTSYFDGLRKKYVENAKKYYPNFEFGSMETGLIFDGELPPFEFEFRLNSKCIKGTEYEVIEESNLIHYTFSPKNVIEILNSEVLRLSNLVNVNDPQEMNSIIKKANIKNFVPYIEALKSIYFSASFCKVINDEKPDEFPMWRLYGNDGRGCAIVFEIENYKKDWYNLILSNVQYDPCAAVDTFIEFINSHYSFQESNNFPLKNIPITITSLLAFHKNEIWKYENEVRLLTYQNYDEYTLKPIDDSYCELKHSISADNKRYSYVELPLYGGKEYNRINREGKLDSFYNILPVLKIKEIILGYRIETNSRNNIIEAVNFISKSYGYFIPVKESHIKEWFYDLSPG